MKRHWLFLLLILLFPACRSEDVTSRFSSNVPAATFAPRGMRPTTLEISDLVEAPASYEGAPVQVSGRYQRRPLLVCDGRARRSPVTWLLREGEAEVGATGYDTLLRRLVPDGLEVTVSGHWQRWRGQVGCGKEAPVREVWYLAVEEIVAPMPLARITVTPGIELTATVDSLGTPDDSAFLPSSTPTPTESVGTPTPDAPDVTRFPTPATARPTATETGPEPEFSSPTPGATETPDLTASATTPPATASAGTPSATPDPLATATITGTVSAPATPTATPTEEGETVTVTNRGTLPLIPSSEFPDLALVMDRLNEDEAHRWQINVEAGETITVSAVAMPAADVRLEIQDASGNTLLSQNDEPAGSVEIVAGVEADSNSTWRILVHETSRDVTYYSLLLNKSTYESEAYYTLAGLIAYNQSRAASLPSDTDQIWVFPGEGGDVISINLAPRDSSDLIFQFYGPSGLPLLSQYKNDSGSGGSEFELNFELPDDGLYAIHVGEIDFRAAEYTLTVSTSAAGSSAPEYVIARDDPRSKRARTLSHVSLSRP